MDRLNRNRYQIAACGVALALVLPATGCKSTRSEVPPSPVFSGNAQAPIGFNKDANPISGAAGLPGANSQYGTPGPSTTPSYGPPGQGGFGGVGTNMGPGAGAATGTGSGMGMTPSTTPSTTAPGADGLSSPLGASNPATGLPQTGTGPLGPAAGIGAAPTAGPFDR